MSAYIKNGVYYALDAVNNEMSGIFYPHAFFVKRDGDNPFAETMTSGVYNCSGWGLEAHVNIDYKSAIGWDKVPKGVEYYILSDSESVYAVTANHARENYELLFSSGQVRNMICNVALDVFYNTGEDAWGDRTASQIEVDMTMAEAAQWDEEEAA